MLVDSLVLGILIVFFLVGYKKGIVAEFISFSALLFNIVLSKEITPLIVERINIPITNKFYEIFVYVGTFVVTYIVFAGIIKFMLRTITGNERLFVDRIIGACLGAIKAVIIDILILLVLLVVSKVSEKVEVQLNSSKIYGLTSKFSESTMLFLPNEIKEMIAKFDYDREIEKAIEKSLGGKK